MREESFEVTVADGVLRGHRAGDGAPALVLHGGPAITDYMNGCAGELAHLLRTVRYQQRGTPPSEVGPPYSIESHMADAIAVLDQLGIDRAWAVGHSWGGHLVLHLAVSHPDRLLGVVCIDSLGAFSDTFPEQDANLRRGLAEFQIARIEEIEALRRRGEATEADLLERFVLLWPQWFADPANAPPNPVAHIGPRCSAETNASISEHFALGTLAARLPDVRLPMLFVHGELDPLPVRASIETAALVPGAHVDTIPDCGHFPWIERPGELRQIVESFVGSLTAGS